MQTVARAPRVRNGIRSSLKYWINIDNQRKRLEEIGKELGVQHLDDWYKIPRTAVYTKLPFVTELYGHLFNALKAVYPQHNWDQIHFSWSNHGQWKDIDTQKKKLEQLAAELGVKTLDDWYNVSRKELYDRAPFIKLYHGCLFTALRTLYPQHNWNESKLSPSYWHSIEHQRKRLDEIGKELGVKQLDDWYSVSRFQLRRKAFFISQYYDSVFSALRAIYPQHPWDELKYSRKPWKMIEGRMKDVMDELMHRYDISALEHWQRVDMHEWRLIKNFAVARFRSVSAMFNSLFPSMATPSKYSKAEAVLQSMLKDVTRVESQVNINGMSVDLYLPELKIAVEYQGDQHYQQFYRGDLLTQQHRDQRKRIRLQELGIQLIQIPFWWNQKWSQLQTTLSSTANRSLPSSIT